VQWWCVAEALAACSSPATSSAVERERVIPVKEALEPAATDYFMLLLARPLPTFSRQDHAPGWKSARVYIHKNVWSAKRQIEVVD
jgi:hypothetical protein